MSKYLHKWPLSHICSNHSLRYIHSVKIWRCTSNSDLAITWFGAMPPIKNMLKYSIPGISKYIINGMSILFCLPDISTCMTDGISKCFTPGISQCFTTGVSKCLHLVFTNDVKMCYDWCIKTFYVQCGRTCNYLCISCQKLNSVCIQTSHQRVARQFNNWPSVENRRMHLLLI